MSARRRALRWRSLCQEQGTLFTLTCAERIAWAERVRGECRADERASLLSRGLADRKAPVRECAQQLLCQWLEADAGRSVPVLLQLLDARQHEKACLQAVGPLPAPHGCMQRYGCFIVLFCNPPFLWQKSMHGSARRLSSGLSRIVR